MARSHAVGAPHGETGRADRRDRRRAAHDNPACGRRLVPALSRGRCGMNAQAELGGTILAIDTATSRVVVARGRPDGTLDDQAGWEAGYRHGEALLPSIERLLAPVGGRAAIGAVVVGTG